MLPGHLKVISGLATAIAIAACSSVPYSPRPLDPQASSSAFLARSGDAEGLKRFAAANGYAPEAWPPAKWGLKDLTLVALYFHPDISIARARADIAHAELASAAAPQSLSGRLRPEYHSRQLPEDKGPWSLGLELEIPLVSQGKLAARTERGAFLADAADIDIANAAWTVRSRVRDRCLDLQTAGETLAALDAQLGARKEMLAMVSRRVDAGLMSTRDLGAERLAVFQLELSRSQAHAAQQHALGALAAALGLSLEVVEHMKLSLDAPLPATADTDAASLRRLALRNRLDVHRQLLEFGAADAQVKEAVAAQNPEVMLGPGYRWDQGDNVWSLAIGLSIPSAARSRAAIREAQARRELAAEQFAATQAEAIVLTERAGAQYRFARERATAAERQMQAQREQEARINREFEAGAADRMQRVSARLETLAAGATLRSAIADLRLALAQLEDAVQRPLFSDFQALPDLRMSPSAGLSTP
jgi:outer membrane protein TolC